jgi:hypothetical protein
VKAGATAAEKAALRILAGCQQGSTEAALLGQGVKLATLTALTRAGKVSTWIEEKYRPRITVRWYALARET